MFVNDASDFVSLIKYQFTVIFPSSNVFNQDLELLFAKTNSRHFALGLLYQSGTQYTLVDSNQNRFMYFLVVKQSCYLAIKLSEVRSRILINDIVSISNDLLTDGEYGLSNGRENRALFLDSCMQFVKSFYSDYCSRKYSK